MAISKRSKLPELPPLTVVKVVADGKEYNYIWPCANRMQNGRLIRTKGAKSVGKILNGGETGLVVWKESFLKKYPQLRAFNVYRELVEQGPHTNASDYEFVFYDLSETPLQIEHKNNNLFQAGATYCLDQLQYDTPLLLALNRTFNKEGRASDILSLAYFILLSKSIDFGQYLNFVGDTRLPAPQALSEQEILNKINTISDIELQRFFTTLFEQSFNKMKTKGVYYALDCAYPNNIINKLTSNKCKISLNSSSLEQSLRRELSDDKYRLTQERQRLNRFSKLLDDRALMIIDAKSGTPHSFTTYKSHEFTLNELKIYLDEQGVPFNTQQKILSGDAYSDKYRVLTKQSASHELGRVFYDYDNAKSALEDFDRRTEPVFENYQDTTTALNNIGSVSDVSAIPGISPHVLALYLSQRDKNSANKQSSFESTQSFKAIEELQKLRKTHDSDDASFTSNQEARAATTTSAHVMESGISGHGEANELRVGGPRSSAAPRVFRSAKKDDEPTADGTNASKEDTKERVAPKSFVALNDDQTPANAAFVAAVAGATGFNLNLSPSKSANDTDGNDDEDLPKPSQAWVNNDIAIKATASVTRTPGAANATSSEGEALETKDGTSAQEGALAGIEEGKSAQKSWTQPRTKKTAPKKDQAQDDEELDDIDDLDDLDDLSDESGEADKQEDTPVIDPNDFWLLKTREKPRLLEVQSLLSEQQDPSIAKSLGSQVILVSSRDNHLLEDMRTLCLNQQPFIFLVNAAKWLKHDKFKHVLDSLIDIKNYDPYTQCFKVKLTIPYQVHYLQTLDKAHLGKAKKVAQRMTMIKDLTVHAHFDLKTLFFKRYEQDAFDAGYSSVEQYLKDSSDLNKEEDNIFGTTETEPVKEEYTFWKADQVLRPSIKIFNRSLDDDCYELICDIQETLEPVAKYMKDHYIDRDLNTKVYTPDQLDEYYEGSLGYVSAKNSGKPDYYGLGMSALKRLTKDLKTLLDDELTQDLNLLTIGITDTKQSSKDVLQAIKLLKSNEQAFDLLSFDVLKLEKSKLSPFSYHALPSFTNFMRAQNFLIFYAQALEHMLNMHLVECEDKYKYQMDESLGKETIAEYLGLTDANQALKTLAQIIAKRSQEGYKYNKIGTRERSVFNYLHMSIPTYEAFENTAAELKVQLRR